MKLRFSKLYMKEVLVFLRKFFIYGHSIRLRSKKRSEDRPLSLTRPR